MLEKMKQEISDNIQKAYESGKITVQEIETTVENAVSKVAQHAKNGVVDMNMIAKEAVTTTIEELQLLGKVTKEIAEAVVNGTLNGINRYTKESMNEIDMELLKTKYRLQEQKDKFILHLKDAFDGVKEATSKFSGATQNELEEAVNNNKLKSIEVLGLMEETIKQSVKVVIEEGEDVQTRVAHITQEATKNALKAGRLTAQRTKAISELAIFSAIDASQELEKNIEETTLGAIEGTKLGIINSIERVAVELIEAKDRAVDFVEEDIQETIEDFKALENASLEALSSTMNRVESEAKEILWNNINIMQKSVSEIKIFAEEVIDVAIDYLKEQGSQSSYSIVKERVFELTERAKEEVKVLVKMMTRNPFK